MQEIVITKRSVKDCKECEFVKWSIKRIDDLFCTYNIPIFYEEVIDNELEISPIFQIKMFDKSIVFQGLPGLEELKAKCYEKFHTACGREYFKFMHYATILMELYFLKYIQQVCDESFIEDEIQDLDRQLTEVFS